jgi:hypothetical protein
MAGSGGSKLVIYVARRASDRGLSGFNHVSARTVMIASTPRTDGQLPQRIQEQAEVV